LERVANLLYSLGLFGVIAKCGISHEAIASPYCISNFRQIRRERDKSFNLGRNGNLSSSVVSDLP
jgi:hypothetical protein